MPAPDPRDLGPLEKAVNDAAGRASVTWVSFLSLATYLAIATGSVTHRDLFLDEPVTLPVLNVRLPLLGFFVVAPMFFLISHFYALLQLQALMEKVADYTRLLRETVTNNEVERHLLRQRLDSFLFLQLSAHVDAGRGDLVARLYRIIAWITMVGAPVAVLLLVQLTFLPYHHEGVTWLHRFVILADVMVTWLLWPRVRPQRLECAESCCKADEEENKAPQPTHSVRAYVAAIAVLAFSWIVARFPGEAIYPEHASLTQWLFEGAVDEVRGRPAGWLSNRLVLPDQDFIDDEKLARHNTLAPDQPFLVMRGRNLRKAVLLRSDLRQADFSGAELQGANLSGARLQKAWFVHRSDTEQRFVPNAAANLEGATLTAADLTESRLANVVAREATFESAKLTLADLSGARLEGATFLNAVLTSAKLERAMLQGSFWFMTQAQDVQLRGAVLVGATMWETNLQGADLRNADLRAVMFADAQLQGANLASADVSAASFLRAQLQGVDLSVREARSTAFCRAYVFRARADNDSLTEARISATRKVRALRVNSRTDVIELAAHQYYTFAHDLIQTLPRRAGTQAVHRQTVPPRVRARKSLQRLSPYFQSPVRDLLDRGQWLRLEKQAAPADRYVLELSELLVDIACNLKGGPYVARGIAWSGLLRSVGPASAAVVARLRNPNKCPGARMLDSAITRWPYSSIVSDSLEYAAKEHCGERLTYPDPWPPELQK